jgi:putative addiction module killer protein
MQWDILYSEHVQNWLDELDKQQLKSLAKELRLIELCGNQLKLPHSKSLGAGLFELRERSYGLRIYYCFKHNNCIILLNGGDKKTQTKDIKKARTLLKEHQKEQQHESQKF